MSESAELSVSAIRPVEVEFITARFRADEALWVADEWVADQGRDDRHRRFAQQFSFAVRAGECFAGVPFAGEGAAVLKAERYGGYGVGRNGGGSRCGNLNGYQLKGIGPNPLVGDDGRSWHSYGGLNARDAVCEALMAQVLARVLPIGAAKIYGVILTSSDGAYYEGDESDPSWTRGWGAILVREICLRPGHFLRAPDYKPRRDAGVRIAPDSVRVREINHALHAAFPDVDHLIKRLGGFLQSCAHQFSFAKLARIIHGSVGPSNISFDGRWLDLTNSSFIGGGENIGGIPPVYEEPFAVRQIVTELLDTFAKYNRLELNSGSLIKYYDEQLEAYYAHSLPSLFGIDPKTVACLATAAESGILLSQVTRVLNSGRTVVVRWPTSLSVNDPVLIMQRGLFVAFFDESLGLAELADLERTAPGFSAHLAAAQFAGFVRAAHGAASGGALELASFVRLCAVDALKRTMFAEYFFKGRLMKHIKVLLNSDPSACRRLIEESIALAEWIFKPAEDGCSYLYRSDGLSLAFDARARSYIVAAPDSGRSLSTPDAEVALEAVEQSPAEDFVIQSYDFRVPLTRLLRTLMRMRAPGDGTARICERMR